MRVFLSGRPRTGKTTLCLRAFEVLKRNGVRVGGVVTREIVRGQKREGFEIINLKTKERVLLAHIKGSGPKIGKYRVFVRNIEEYMVKWIEESLKEDFVIVDEIGPMELLSKEFLPTVEKVVQSRKDFIMTVHWRKIGIIENYKPYTFYFLTFENRNQVWEELYRQLLSYVKSKSF